METIRAVEVLTDVRRSSGASWLLGSGFVLREGVVVTAAHVVGSRAEAAGARIWVRDLHSREWRAELRTYDQALDLAVLGVPGLGQSLASCPVAAIGREQARVVSDVLAVGFPGFKDAAEKPKALRRQAAQADGWIPTAENYGGGELVLKLRAAPPEISPGSPWAGFSGAGVIADERLVGIAIEHRSGEGSGSLMLRPISALAAADPRIRDLFAAAFGGVDFGALPTIPCDARAQSPSRPELRVRIDRVRRFSRRSRTGAIAFGTFTAPDGATAFGEGAHVQATIENRSASGAIVSSVDLVVQAYDASFVAEYPATRLPGLHLEVPLSVLANPVRLDELAELDASVPLTLTQIALDPAGRATAHHTINFGVLAAMRGLWTLAVRAKHFRPQSPNELADTRSDSFYVGKR